jgi:hypothetical protein
MRSCFSVLRPYTSLQEYLRAWLIRAAAEPILEEGLDRSGGSVPLESAVKSIRSDRDRR